MSYHGMLPFLFILYKHTHTHALKIILTDVDGDSWSQQYCRASGEMHWPLQDYQKRKRLTRLYSLWLYINIFYTHTHIIRIYFFYIKTNYNEERRLGDQRGSDTLVVPFFTSNDGLSFALFYFMQTLSQPAKNYFYFSLSSNLFLTRYLYKFIYARSYDWRFIILWNLFFTTLHVSYLTFFY
jgi:hypothetical protein